MKELQCTLEEIQPELTGSIILVSGHEEFTVASNNVSPQTQFYIGSLTKQFCAFIFLNLLKKKYPSVALENLLARNLDIEFPNLTILKNITWAAKCSLLDLLTHHSGLSDYIAMKNLNAPIDPIQILQSVQFSPEKHYQYSNANYFLLGKLIEEISGESFEMVFNETIKVPAQMNSSFAPTVGNYHQLRKENRFHNLITNLNSEFFIDMANAVGTGNVISTAEDLLKWNQYLYSESNSEIRKILLQNYGKDDDEDIINLGLTTSETPAGSMIGFQGCQDSHHSFIGCIPTQQFNFVVLSNNQQDYEKLLEILTHSLDADDTPALGHR